VRAWQVAQWGAGVRLHWIYQLSISIHVSRSISGRFGLVGARKFSGELSKYIARSAQQLVLQNNFTYILFGVIGLLMLLVDCFV